MVLIREEVLRMGEMITRNDERRLIELAFDYVSAESEQQSAQSRDEAAKLATETTTLKVWLELIDYIKAWNGNQKYEYPMGRGSALQFFLTRQTELEPSPTGTDE